ncbi:putative NADP-dependent alcohol dehydrogenase C 2 [Mycena albidolilacea]|uniref:NADP-dependent alcohol dehydrogenase C 2 n=1 Tax=Mycena albidolilacea TaxID=1033008 RepID=A0AAD7A0B4_9AGAR|nr:putative NADP-dependent alcohol dehydrogenase C 2 [Mycena albidolilacea]
MGIDITVFKGSKDGIVQTTTHSELPTGNQILIKITHSGICGTDEHYKETDMVLGHEGVGTVQELGKDVKGFKVGDLVGWGYTHVTCGTCDQCLLGQDQYCQYREYYGASNFHQGSFGSHAIWDASFVFHVPEGLAPDFAAPLMCGGATVFNVIETYNIRPTDRVGVVGVGGLGHLAIQFLAKMGASVIVFSSTDSKREQARDLGATEFYATKGVDKLNIGKPIDHLIVTTNSLPSWNLFLDVLKPTGSIYPLTINFGNFDIPTLPVVVKGITIQGTAVAARSVHKRMLDFAARHGVHPIIERFPLTKSGVEEGMAKLREGKMRYRGVLVA